MLRAMSKRNPRVFVRFSCGHHGYWNADACPVDARPCRDCREIVTAVEWWDKVWQVHCVGGCHWGRFAGQDEPEANRLGAKHHHITTVTYDYVEEELREPLPSDWTAGMLPLFSDVAEEAPPF